MGEEVRQTVCVEQLQCSSDVPTSTPTPAIIENPANSSQIMNAELNGAIKTVDYPYRVVRNMKDSPDSNIWFIVSCVFIISLSVLLLSYCGYVCFCKPKAHIYSKTYTDQAQSDEEDPIQKSQ